MRRVGARLFWNHGERFFVAVTVRISNVASIFSLGFVVYFGLAVASVFLARVSHDVAVFWPANAVLVAMALSFGRREFPILLLSAFAANVSTQFVYGDNWQLAVGFPLANSFEILAVYIGFQFVGFQNNGTTTPQRGLLLLAIVALAAIPAAAMGAATVTTVFGAPFTDTFTHWWAGDIVSSMIVYLPVFAYRRSAALQKLSVLLTPPIIIECCLLVASFAFGFLVLLALHLPPAIVLVFPTLWLALKGRVFEVAMASSVLSLGTSAAVVMGFWPSLAAELVLRDAVFQQQTLALFCTFPSFLIALAIANFETSQENLEARKKVLDTTLTNMNQGVSVFDKNHRLVLWNDNYLKCFGMNETDVEKGVSFTSLLELQRNNGDFDGNPVDLQNTILARVSRGEEHFAETELGSGRFIKSVHSPTPEGGWIGTHEDVTEFRMLEKRLAHESLHDVMTGVPNRRYFEREFTDRLIVSQLEKKPIALYTIDLDKFKMINDTYGHDVGDDVLLWAATTIKRIAGEHDFVARMGGDEFIMIGSENTHVSQINRTARRLCDELDRTMQFKGNMCICRASIGVAYSVDGQISRHDLLTQSDIALYAAKQAGRGTYRVYDFATGQHQPMRDAS